MTTNDVLNNNNPCEYPFVKWFYDKYTKKVMTQPFGLLGSILQSFDGAWNCSLPEDELSSYVPLTCKTGTSSFLLLNVAFVTMAPYSYACFS